MNANSKSFWILMINMAKVTPLIKCSSFEPSSKLLALFNVFFFAFAYQAADKGKIFVFSKKKTETKMKMNTW